MALRKVRPRTRTAWFAFYVAGLDLLLLLLKYALKFLDATRASAALGPWTGFLELLLCGLLVFLGFRWFRNFILWRLRNRLIVTYLFIGGVPVVLVASMALIAAYFLSGQFATFLAVSQVREQLQELHDANVDSAQHVARSAKPGQPPDVKIDQTVFPGRSIFVLPEASHPKWLADGFTGLIMDRGQIFLRAATVVHGVDKPMWVISSVPVDQKFLARMASGLGPLTLYVPNVPGELAGEPNNVAITPAGVEINGKPTVGISAGSLPEPQFRGDKALNYYALVQPTRWDSGKDANTFLTGSVRLSTLYARLSVSVTEWASFIRILLTGLAATFGIIVLVALLIGIRLTRTITRSVANLYQATEHINRGDFTHRIEVKEHDQLATLQVAFNSMTESLEKLIAEQKEKERLQSELAIAQEVQAQLFPKATSGTGTLELCGLCRPARMVSGDYYDFLSYGGDQIGIAVGDISGKGISAALLMATIHSAVRAYEQEQFTAMTASSSLKSASSGSVALAMPASLPQSPSQLLWLLNRHLYLTTQPEKYATLFLGFYDGRRRQVTYSNAGHLPPLILGADRSVRRLDAGGTVVGLFEDVQYQERTIQLHPEDIFVAFSDGITEPENEFGEFGENRLIETIETHRNLPLNRLAEQVIAAVQDWIGPAEQPDDITLVLARSRT